MSCAWQEGRWLAGMMRIICREHASGCRLQRCIWRWWDGVGCKGRAPAARLAGTGSVHSPLDHSHGLLTACSPW